MSKVSDTGVGHSDAKDVCECTEYTNLERRQWVAPNFIVGQGADSLSLKMKHVYIQRAWISTVSLKNFLKRKMSAGI